MVDNDEIGLIGALYDISTGEVIFKDFSATVRVFDNSKLGKLQPKLKNLFA